MPFTPSPSDIATEVRDRFLPFLTEHNNAPVDRDLVRAAAARGLLSQAVPIAAGGEGQDPFSWGVTLEQIAYYSAEFSLPLLLGSFGLVASALAELEDELVQELVPQMLRGERLVSWAQPPADPHGVRIQLTDATNELTGEGQFFVGGALSDLLVVAGRDGKHQIGLYLVERRARGLTIELPPVGGGLRHLNLADARFNKVPVLRILDESRGMELSQAFQHRWNALLMCVVLGQMYAVCERCTRFLSRTVIAADPMSDPLHLRSSLGLAYESLESSRTVVYRLLDRLRWVGHDLKWDPQIAIAKYHVSDRSVALGLQLLQLVGADPEGRRMGLDSYLRDVIALTPVAGAHHDLKLELGYDAFAEHETYKVTQVAWARQAVREYWQTLPWWKRAGARVLGRVPDFLRETATPPKLPPKSS